MFHSIKLTGYEVNDCITQVLSFAGLKVEEPPDALKTAGESIPVR
jgi:hypothetical protein